MPAIPIVTPLPQPPSEADPVNFGPRSDTLFGALPTMVDEINEVTGAIPQAAQQVAQEAAEAVAEIFDVGNYYSRAQVDALLDETEARLRARAFFLGTM